MASDKFFSDDYLDQLNPQKQAEQEPVTVFGLTFKNDDERRQYFRDELRRRLPDLRKIEGFPIGEDDDIINLSDPPYYTACPNPWLNDFIKQWEEEKKELQREGKRKTDFEVKEPYASDVSEGKNNPIYNAHSYHTKVPHPAIMRYILHYTEPGDIVYDGFCGTGMTGVAATLCSDQKFDSEGKITTEFQKRGSEINWGKRHAILGDLSPVASLISGVYNSHLNMSVIEKMSDIVSEAKSEFGWMYETNTSSNHKAQINYVVWSDVFVCPHCGNEIIFTKEAVDTETSKVKDSFCCPNCKAELTKKTVEKCWESVYDDVLKESIQHQKRVPVFINYSIGRRSYNKELDANDYNVLAKANELAKSFSWTKDRMIEGSEARRNDRQGITHVHQFYFSRSLVILEYILSKCNDKELKFLVNSQLVNISKLNRYRPGISFPYNPLSGTLYIGSQISESNVFVALENKLKKLSVAFGMLNADNATGVSSATHTTIKDNSIDYIFTDPPFGANISYSELNCIQESWLRVKTDNTEEAIVNESLSKDRDAYQDLMTKSLREYYRVLKPGKWITIEFSNTSASIWNAIQAALQNAGFIMASVAALDKQTGSFKAVTTTTAVKQDLVITCYKPSNKLTDKFLQSGGTKENVWDFVDEHLLHLPVHIEKGNATTSVVERSPKILFDRLISYYVQKGFAIPMDAQEFQKGLHERYAERDGMFFTVAQAVEYEEKKLKAPEFVPMGIMVSDEANGIEWLKNELRNNPQTRQDIFTNWTKAIAGVRKGDVIPELDTLLEENFIQNEDGTWRLANVNDDVDLEKLRTKALLKEFKLYLEVCRKPRGKLKDVRVEAVRAGFKQCYSDMNFADIILVGDRIPQNLLTEDEVLLQYYDIASSKV